MSEQIYDLVGVIALSDTVGTGDYQLGAAHNGYLTPAQAGAVAGRLYAASVFNALPGWTRWERGLYRYQTGPARFERVTIRDGSSGAGNPTDWQEGDVQFVIVGAQPEDGVLLDTAGQLPPHLGGGRKNAIIDGMFNLWPQGNGPFASAGYTAGMWAQSVGAGNTISTSRQTFTLGQTQVPGNPRFYLRLARTTTGSGDSVLYQNIEPVWTFAGRLAIFSIWARASTALDTALRLTQIFGTGGPASSNNIIVSVSRSLTTVWQQISVARVIDSVSGKTVGTDGNHALRCSVILPAAAGNAHIDLAVADLRLGDVAPAQPERNEEADRFLLERRYRRLGLGIAGQVLNANEIHLAGTLSPPMLRAPVATLLTATPSILAPTSVSASGASIAASSLLPDGWRARIDGFSGLTTGQAIIGFTTGGIISLDARI